MRKITSLSIGIFLLCNTLSAQDLLTGQQHRSHPRVVVGADNPLIDVPPFNPPSTRVGRSS